MEYFAAYLDQPTPREWHGTRTRWQSLQLSRIIDCRFFLFQQFCKKV